MWYWIVGVLVVGLAAALLGARPLGAWMQRKEAERCLSAFRRQREVLEARFFELASTSGKPRGLRWLDCDWLDDVTFARDRQTGLLTAFSAVNVRFEAIEG